MWATARRERGWLGFLFLASLAIYWHTLKAMDVVVNGGVMHCGFLIMVIQITHYCLNKVLIWEMLNRQALYDEYRKHLMTQGQNRDYKEKYPTSNINIKLMNSTANKLGTLSWCVLYILINRELKANSEFQTKPIMIITPPIYNMTIEYIEAASIDRIQQYNLKQTSIPTWIS